ncbi:MAG: hypothetical protein DRJ61_05625 [Acidobacteria bacterium]|nr:MAG: hypothetical protein DRJ61_05625 [Acidobacteriota bacterium]
MIKINLVSSESEAAVTKRATPEISLGGHRADIILLTVLAIGMAVTGIRWYMLHNTIVELKGIKAERTIERDELQKYIDKVEELEAKRAELKAKIDTIRQLKENQKGPVRMLDEVSRAMPDLVWLTGLNLAGTHVTLNGMALDENAFANYVDNLNASPFFGEPTVVTLQRTRDDAFTFRLECDFTYTPAEIASTSVETEG